MDIQLKPVESEHLKGLLELSKGLPEDQQKAVANNLISLAEAYVNYEKAWPRVIFDGDTMIGFLMVDLQFDQSVDEADYPFKLIDEPERPSCELWRLMLGKAYQGKGYGTKVLDRLIIELKKMNYKTLFTSCVRLHPMPYAFYMHYGFIDTGHNNGEQILKLALK